MLQIVDFVAANDLTLPLLVLVLLIIRHLVFHLGIMKHSPYFFVVIMITGWYGATGNYFVIWLLIHLVYCVSCWLWIKWKSRYSTSDCSNKIWYCCLIPEPTNVPRLEQDALARMLRRLCARVLKVHFLFFCSL